MELYQESDSCQEESDGVWNAAQCCRDEAEGGEGNQAGGLQSKRQEDLQGKRRQSGTQETVNQNRNMVQKQIHHCLLFERTQVDQRDIYSCDIFIKHFNRCTLNKCKLIK